MSHHPAILAVPREPFRKPAGYVLDFVGVRTRIHYSKGLRNRAATQPVESDSFVPPLPPFGEPYFEWIDVLQSVLDARDRYVVCEVGAGWGRWAVRAACALRLMNPLPFKCIAAEPEPQHFRWMREHFADNDIDPRDSDLVWAVVGPQSGAVPFWVGDADHWYGQAVAESAPPPLDSRARRRLMARGLLGRPPRIDDARAVIWVPSVTLADLLGDEPRVDLLDIDAQGAELALLEPAAALIDRRVKRVHIGTHTREIEDGLRRLFQALGWQRLVDYPCRSTAETPYGVVPLQEDGIQSWLNPRLVDGVAAGTPGAKVGTPQESIERNDSRLDQLTAENARLASTVATLRERLARLQAEAEELRRRSEKRRLRIEQLKAKKAR